MNVQAVDEHQVVQVLACDPENVIFGELTVGIDEVSAEARKLRLDQALDAGVFDYVEEVTAGAGVVLAAGNTVRGICPFGALGSVEGVADLVTDEHIVHGIGHVLPHGQAQYAALGVEVCGFGLGVVDDRDVLRGHSTGEDIAGCSGLVRYGSSGGTHTHIVPYPGPRSTHRDEKIPILCKILLSPVMAGTYGTGGAINAPAAVNPWYYWTYKKLWGWS